MHHQFSLQRAHLDVTSSTPQRRAKRITTGSWRDAYSLLLREGGDWTPLHVLPMTELTDGGSVLAATFLAKVEQTLPALHARRQRSTFEFVLSLPKISPNGFDIDVLITPDRISASFGGLDQDFGDLAGSLRWVRRGLCADYHLTITQSGRSPVEWQLTRTASPGETSTTLAAGHSLWWRRWRGMTTIERRNDVLPELCEAKAFAPVCAGGVTSTGRALRAPSCPR